MQRRRSRRVLDVTPKTAAERCHGSTTATISIEPDAEMVLVLKIGWKNCPYCDDALRLEGRVYAGLSALRITGGKFATLASQAEGCGNPMLAEQQSACGGSSRDLLADSWRLGKNDTHT
jgi:hypothetical protein